VKFIFLVGNIRNVAVCRKACITVFIWRSNDSSCTSNLKWSAPLLIIPNMSHLIHITTISLLWFRYN